MHKYILNKNLNCIPREELTRANSAPKGIPRNQRTFQFTRIGKTEDGEKIKGVLNPSSPAPGNLFTQRKQNSQKPSRRMV